MAKPPSPKASFSLGQRWGIFFSVLVSIVAMTAVLVMLNYLGARYYLRFPWSMQTRKELSSQTLNVLKSVTNNINVIIYYNKNDLLYGYVKDLLDDYRLINPKISVRTVDYLVDAADAQKVKDAYSSFMDPAVDTNLVIFSSASGTNIVPGELLGHYVIEAVPNEKEREFRNKLTFFYGEPEFTAKIYQLINPHPIRAYFLESPGGVHHLNGQGKLDYQKFKTLLQNYNIDITNIASLRGSNGVPADCKLLVIAGPSVLTHAEVVNVRHYLDQGGRLFVLFNYLSRDINTGLEPLLADWGIAVKHNTIRDIKNSTDDSGNDVVISSFNKAQPIVSHLQGFVLELILPRSIETNSANAGPDAAAAQELAWTSASATINDNPLSAGKPIPLMVAVEKGDAKGISEQSTTRIVAVGDSFFLDNEAIIAGRNKSFAGYAVNWLMGQTLLLQGVGPQVIQEYKLMVTPAQSQNIRWILLAGMPGSILLLGGLVWLRRRR